MARKSFRKSGNKRKRQHGGSDSGATGYVGGLFGDLAQQTATIAASGSTSNVVMPMNAASSMNATPIQSGGKSKKRGKKSKPDTAEAPSNKRFIPTTPSAAALAGGASKKRRKHKKHGGNPLTPADYTAPAGQTGGFFSDLIERAGVPFGLMGIHSLYGKKFKSRKNRH